MRWIDYPTTRQICGHTVCLSFLSTAHDNWEQNKSVAFIFLVSVCHNQGRMIIANQHSLWSTSENELSLHSAAHLCCQSFTAPRETKVLPRNLKRSTAASPWRLQRSRRTAESTQECSIFSSPHYQFETTNEGCFMWLRLLSFSSHQVLWAHCRPSTVVGL